MATVEPVVVAQGMELVDLVWQKEGGRQFLRVFIDKPGGVTLDDCATVSRALDAPLEPLDLAAYHLEVSSPGAERPLKTDRDLTRFRGRLVEVRTSPPFEGTRKFRGKLLGHDAEHLRLDWEGKEVALPRATITQARLALVMPGSHDETEGGQPIIHL